MAFRPSQRFAVSGIVLDQAVEYHEKEVVKLLEGWKLTHSTPDMADDGTKPTTVSNLAADIESVKIEDDCDVVDMHEANERDSSALDPAIFAALPLDPALTTVTPYGPPGSSIKARISTILAGQNRR